jgi:hypothetical protein
MVAMRGWPRGATITRAGLRWPCSDDHGATAAPSTMSAPDRASNRRNTIGGTLP